MSAKQQQISVTGMKYEKISLESNEAKSNKSL